MTAVFYNFIYRSDVTISDSVRPVIFTPKNKKIDDLLRELQQKKLHIAVAMDEYGGTAGIITLEDILEELVGEIWDEHDKVETEIERISDNEYLVAGKTKVEKLFECLDREAEFDVQTVSGWVMELFECIPKAGDFHTDEEFKLEIEVTEMSGKRIEQVRIRDLREPEEEEKE